MAKPDTLISARDAVRSKKISSVELTREALGRIEKLEPRIGAFNSVYADRAMELLSRAVRAGYNNAAHMEKDTDLDSLRQREDFQKLLAGLRAGKK